MASHTVGRVGDMAGKLMWLQEEERDIGFGVCGSVSVCVCMCVFVSMTRL